MADKNPFSDPSFGATPGEQPAKTEANPFADPDFGKGGTASDLAKSFKSGVEQLPGMVTGIADIVPAIATGTRPFTAAADALGEATGFQPGKWAKDTKYSQGYNQSQKEIADSWKGANDAVDDPNLSIGDKAARVASELPGIAKAYATNPAYVANQVVESVPSMVAGGFASKGAMVAGRVAGAVADAAAGTAAKAAVPGFLERTVGEKLAAPIAGAAGEGAVTAGQQMDQYEGTDQRRNALASLGAGVGTAAIGVGAGRLANKMGLETAETAMAKVGDKAAAPLAEVPLSAKRRILGGMVSEAVLQELPQSMQEQMWQNYADGKPLWDGVLQQGVEGALAGGVMGGAANIRGEHHASAEPAPGAKPAPVAPEGMALAPGWTPPTDGSLPPAEPGLGFHTPGMRLSPINNEAPPGSVPFENVQPEGPTAPGMRIDTSGLSLADAAGANEGPQPGAREFDTGTLGLADTNTPTPQLTRSQSMGIDPNAGPLSTAAALAVDGGAHDNALAQAAAQAEAEQGDKKKPAAAAADGEGFAAPAPLDPAARAVFPTYEEADAYRRTQKVTGSHVAALPVPVEGGFSLAMKGTPEYAHGEQLRAERQAAKGKANVQNPAPGATQAAPAQATRAEAPQTAGGNAAAPAGVSAAGAAKPLEAAGVAKAPIDIKTITSKTLPEMSDAELVQAAKHYGPSHKRTAKIEKELSRRTAAAPATQQAIAQAAHEAATSEFSDKPAPTDAQKEAGNYKKGHVSINGLDVSIENAAGTQRSPEWPALANHYGYFKGTVGFDKDHVDVFLTDRAHDASLPVFVVDQRNTDGSFDEHKVVMGATDEADARRIYQSNYSKDWKGLGAITQMSLADFKAWVRDPSKTTKPAATTTETPNGTQADQAQQAEAQRQEAPAATDAAVAPAPRGVLAKKQQRDDAEAALLKFFEKQAREGSTKPMPGMSGGMTFQVGGAPFNKDNETTVGGPGLGAGLKIKHDALWKKAQANVAAETAPERAKSRDDQAAAVAERFGMKPSGISTWEADDIHGKKVTLQAYFDKKGGTTFTVATLVKGDNYDFNHFPTAEAAGEFIESIKPPTSASGEQLPTGEVVIPADADVFAAALKDVMDGGFDAAAAADEHDRGDQQRHAATFRPKIKPVSLPRLDKSRPTAQSMPFISPAEAAARIESWKAEADRQGRENASANANRTVLSFFDASGVLAQPWIDAGYNVVTYDLQTGADINEFNAENLLEQHGNDEIWAILAQPPCTDFASSGAQWWKDKDADGRTEASNELVRQTLRTIELFRPPVWVMENPVGRIAELNKLPEPKLSFDPWAFGDPYTKRTRLWGRFDNQLPTAPVEPTDGSKMHKLSSSAKYERSLTPEGFSYALFMANNAESFPLAERLAQEFAGVEPELFKGAVDAGKSEDEIRNAIVDSYYDSDLEWVRKELRDMAGKSRYTIVDNGDTNPGEFIVKGDGHNLARFEINKSGAPVKVKHFFESKQTRDPVTAEIGKFARQRRLAPAPAAAPAPRGVLAKLEETKKGKKANPDRKLRQSWGVEGIDAYVDHPEFTTDRDRDVPSGGVKAAFLKDGRDYLSEVSRILQERGYTPQLDGKGKPTKPVHVNEGGPAVAGDVYLTLMAAEGKEITVQFGESMNGGGKPSLRASTQRGGNLFAEPTMTAGELADWLEKRLNVSPVGQVAAAPAAAPTGTGMRVIINKLGADGLTDEERAAGKPSYADAPAPAKPAPPKIASESDQDRSNREWAENYSRVAATDDLSTVSTKDLERAESYASQRRAHEQRKGWGGDASAVNAPLVEALGREIEQISFELKKRRAAAEAPAVAPAMDVQAQLDAMLAPGGTASEVRVPKGAEIPDAIFQAQTNRRADPGYSMSMDKATGETVFRKNAAAPEPKSDELKEREKAAKAKMLNAAGKLAHLLSKNTRASITPEQEQAMLPIVIELFEGAMDLGFIKFKQAARYVREFIANAIDQDAADAIPIDTLQGAYIATARRHKDKAITPKGEVVTVESIDELEDTDGNATRELDRPSTSALEGAPSEDVRAPAEGGQTGQSPDGRGERDGQGHPSADGAGVDLAGSVGANPGDVSVPAGGTRADAKDGKKPRVPRAPRPDAGSERLRPEQLTEAVAGAGLELVQGRATDAKFSVKLPGYDYASAIFKKDGAAWTVTMRGKETTETGDLDAMLKHAHELLSGSVAPNAPHVAAPQIKAEDFTIDEDFALGEGGQKTKYRENVAAIRLLAELESSDRMATPDEQRVLAKYVGWGGISQVFDAEHKDWQKEHAELKGLMTPEEWAAAARSTRYAHYTSRPIIVDGIYAALRRFGFTGGKTLEAGAGVGNFMGLMPADMRSAGRFTAIEREPFSSAIAKHLYPQQIVVRDDFTMFKGNDAYFDAAVGNPPFAADPQTDQSGRKHLSGLTLHNYFFAKAVDMLREGGVLAQVVTNSFLDAKTDAARRYISDRTVFLGAIRLPNSAFAKNANTEVTTDIIFLQKRPDAEIGGKAAKQDAKRWLDTGVHIGKNGKPVALNQYFIDNPHMMLGDYGAFGTMYGPEFPALIPRDGQDTLAMLKEAVGKLPEGVYKSIAETRTEGQSSAAIVALKDPSVQEGGYFAEGDKLMQRLPDLGGEARGREITPATQWTEKTTLGDSGFARIKALAELRKTLRGLIAAEMSNDDRGMGQLRATLNEQYDAYRKEHGFLNDPSTLRVFDDDPDFPLLASLEHKYTPGIGVAAAKRQGIKPTKATADKAPIFERRVVASRTAVTKVETPADALAVSMAERGRLDATYISKLLNRDAEEVLRELASGDKPLLFRDPATDEYVLRDAYLSGNVRAKLAQAKESGMSGNVRALEEVQPEDVGASEIVARVGSPWIPESVYGDFATKLFGEGTNAHIRYLKTNSSYQVYITPGNQVAWNTTWGTQDMDGGKLLASLLNNRVVKVTRVDGEGKVYTDQAATELAQAKEQEIREAFNDWLFKDGDRAEVLTRAYNDTNNNYVTRVYDGSMMTFPGKVPDDVIKFRRHQRDAIARTVQDRTALYDHVVGAGKTFTVVASAMELKRTGLANKPMVAVPNHLVKQWAADFYRLYPGANILTATKKDFARENRRKFLAKIATGDWDAVVIAHSSFGFIKPAPEFEASFNQKEIASIMATIKQVEEGDGDKPQKKRAVKQLEGLVERLENRIKALRDKPMDDLLDFEQIGVDQLFVDEFHMFKNLMFSTKMQNVQGLGDSTGSQRAYDMYVKINQIFAKNGRDQGVVAATGTPVSNSLAEMYHMMRYLMPTAMKDLGFESFDAWANTFASVEQVWMQKPSGDGFKASSRMSTFVNTPELLKMFDQVCDTVTMDDIKRAYAEENDGAEFPLPKIKGGRRTPISLDKTPAQEAYMEELAKRALAVEQRKGPPQKGEDNVLVIMGDGRKAAMDIRLVDLDQTEREPGGRIDRASNEIAARYKQYNHVKGTQLVFSDLGTPIKHAKAELKEYQALQDRVAAATDDVNASAALGNESAISTMEDAEAAQAELDSKGPDWLDAVKAAERGFSVYDDLRAALIEKGIPENEVAFIHDYNTDDQKAALFRKVNAGDIRVLLGSTAKMGAGTNVQERLVAEHHLDVPWRPSDVEQREGRIERQGNILAFGPNGTPGLIPNFEAEILAYVTKDTLDMRMWQVQETKLKMINQLRTRKVGREVDNAFEDLELSAGEMQAAATGNIDLLHEIQLRGDVKKLEQRKRSYDANRNELDSRRRRNADRIADLPGKVAEIEAEASQVRAYERDAQSRLDDFKATIDGKEYTNWREAQAHLREVDERKETVTDLAGDKKERAAPISVDINGTTYTARAAMAEAFSELRGDMDPIVWNVGGEDLRRRTRIANAIRPGVLDALADETTKQLGKIAGYDVAVEGELDKGGTTIMDVTLSKDGKVVRDQSVGVIDSNRAPDKVVSLVDAMLKSIAGDYDYLKFQLARAEKEKADLAATADVSGEWPDQAKLDTARAKHKEVLARLAGKGDKSSAAVVSEATEQTQDEKPASDTASDIAYRLSSPDLLAALQPGKRAQAVEAVKGTVDAIRSAWANAPEIVVAYDMNDPAIPERVRQADQRQRSGGASGTPEGFYFDGKVYLMAEKLKTPQDTARVLFHEALGHFGLRKLFGKELGGILNQLATMRRAQVDAKMKEYGLRGANNLDRLDAAEEVLAEMAQTTPSIGLVQRAIAAIRSWLRANVPGFKSLALSDDEIIRNYILPARRFVEDGGPGGPGGPAGGQRVEPAFDRSVGSVTDTPAFRAFFGTSKLTRGGQPVVLYHSSDASFNTFDKGRLGGNTGHASAGLGFFLTPDRAASERYGQHTMPVYARVEKPYVMSTEEFSNFDSIEQSQKRRAELERQGYDGILVKANSTVIVFDPKQIKSATNNNGSFDRDNADIRFSRSTVADITRKATDTLNQTFNHPGKLSVWHKTIGTMYNLAERAPAFKPVFNAAQGFVDDVSYYATDAADLAPKLLPKLEHWKDITKAPVSAADNKAIAKPIFEGTLTWARDDHGKPIPLATLQAEAAKMTAEQKAQRMLAVGKMQPGMLKAWQALPLEQYEAMVESRYSTQMLGAGIVWTPEELKSMFNLTGTRDAATGNYDGQIGLYHEFRQTTDRSLDTMARSDMLRYGGKDVKDLREKVMDAANAQDAAVLLRDYLLLASNADPARASQLTVMANGMIDRADKVKALQDKGYAPLQRFGKFTVDVVVDGNREYFGLFETAREANMMALRMKQEFGKDNVSQGTLSDEAFKMFAGITPESLELFGNMLGLGSTGDAAEDQAFQEYLRLTKSNRSAMKRLIHRQGIAGFSEDVGRVLATFVYSNSRQTAAGLHLGDLGEAITEIPKEQGELKDVAMRLADYVKNPQEEGQAVRGLLFSQYLGGSVASAFVNMTQPIAVTFPWLSQFGGARQSAAQLARAAKGLASRGTVYEDDLAKALKHAEDDGTVSPQEVHQLMAQARGAGTLRSGDGTRMGDARATASNAMSRLALGWGKVFGMAEQVNRRVTFIAAYRIAVAQKMSNPAEFAKKAVTETQFLYSKANKMRFARGAVGGTLMTFKTYSVAYLELLHRMWTQGGKDGKYAALLALGVMMLMGGAGGLPFADDIDDVADGLGQLLGYNLNSKKAKQEFLEGLFGSAMADFIDRGITGLPGAPLDVSGRLGMGNLIPGTGLLTQKTNHTQDVLEIAGPAGDFAGRVFSGARDILSGDIGKGALSMAPKAVQNAAKGADMATTGMYRDAKGYKVLETTQLEAALKAIGFQPATVSKVQEANAINQQAKDFYNLTAQEIRGQWARGIFEQDAGMVADARAAVADWNEKNPEQKMRIDMPSVLKRVKEMRKPKDERIAAAAPKAMRAQMREDVAKVRADF